MIQDIQPYRYDNTYRPGKPEKEDFLLCYEGKKAFLKKEEEGIRFPTFREAEKAWEEDRDKLYEGAIYLFAIDGMKFYTQSGMNGSALEKEGFAGENINIFRDAAPKHLSFAGITGWQLSQWYESRRFCGRCGHAMEHDGKERMMRCPECGLMEFPKICPAVIIGVIHGDSILMSKYAGRDYRDYALLAGFSEVGETIEETVRREVMEEVGLEVSDIMYFKSQPWSFSDTLLMGFFCRLDGQEDIVLDQDELSEAQWFRREEMPVKPNDLSLTNAMMMAFKRGEIR